MPHITVKLWPGKSEDQKNELAGVISDAVCNILGSTEKSVSVSFEEIPSEEWADKVYRPEIQGKPDQVYKKPGYSM